MARQSTRLSGLGLILLTLAACSTTPSDREILESIRDTTYIPLLGSFDPEQQNEAINRFVSNLDNFPEEIATVLAACLRDPVYNERTKLVASCLLAKLKDERGIAELIQNMGSPGENTRELVRDHLLLYGTRILEPVAAVLSDGNVLSRRDAADVLTELGSREGYDLMWRRVSREPDSEVRFVLLLSVAKDSRPVALRRLLESLEDDEELNREIAWGAIQHREGPPPEIDFDAAASPQVREEQLARLRLWLEDPELGSQ